MSMVPTREDHAYGHGFHDGSQAYSEIISRFNETIEGIRAENERLREALLQIKTCCLDNEPEACRQDLALKFVRDVAACALAISSNK